MAARPALGDRQRLRAAAEAQLARTTEPRDRALPAADLLHELQVHQVELEAQNEELRRAQLDLESARNRYEDLYDFAPVGYLTIGDNGLVADLNLTGASLLGQERERLRGCRFAGLVVLRDRNHWQSLKERVRVGRAQEGELRLKRGDGSTFLGRVDCSRIPSAGAGEGFRVVLTDLSERDRAEEELRRARLESLGLLAGGMAHDFNDLLTELLGHVDAARSELPSGHPANEELASALLALRGARHCLRRLLEAGLRVDPTRQGCQGVLPEPS